MVRFCHGESCGQNVLSHLFTKLYLLDRRSHEFVSERYISMGGHVVLDFCFNGCTCLIEKFLTLLDCLVF